MKIDCRSPLRPGTTIYSDMWAAYDNLDLNGYDHGTELHVAFC